MNHNEQYIKKLSEGDIPTIAKCITLVENDLPGSEELLAMLPVNSSKIIGITGAPGAGKSTLVNALLQQLRNDQERIAVLSVDPSSPFNLGALLGDRIRMCQFFLDPQIYIRSLASRKALGGLHPRILEILAVVGAAQFDTIILETVGVGQSEIDIAGIADTTIVLVVPEGGDEVQTMKAGVMEIADLFIVNKSDRPGADHFVKNLSALAHSKPGAWTIPVIQTIADQEKGIDKVIEAIQNHHQFIDKNSERKKTLQAQKIYSLIADHKMKNISIQEIKNNLANQNEVNIFSEAKKYL